MKPDTIWPNAPGTQDPAAAPNFVPADQIAAFASANGMRLRGHTLLWHQTAPRGSSPAINEPDRVSRQRAPALCTSTSSRWCSTSRTCTHGTSSTKWRPTRRMPRIRTAPTAPGTSAYSAGGIDGRRVRARRLHVRRRGARADRQEQRHHETHAQRLQHRAAGQARQRHADRAGRSSTRACPSTAWATSSTCSSMRTSPQVTAALTAVEGHLEHAGQPRDRARRVHLRRSGHLFSARTIPPCLADYGASPPQSAAVRSRRLSIARCSTPSTGRASRR